jgi:long-subunit fatty acid transport protein
MMRLAGWSRGVYPGVALSLAICALAPSSAAAQTSLQIPLQFDFINPGAKSLALGGAFAGLADDATATFANPAGLTQLLGPELSVEIRGTRSLSPFLERGRLSGTIINEGVDVIQGPVFVDSTGTHVGVGYFAGVYPHRSFRWVVAGYRHELARVDQTFLSQGVFQQDPTEFTSRRDSPQEGVRNVSITGYGAAGAYKLRQNVSIGGALTLYSFDINSVFRRFDIDGFLGPPKLDVEFGRSSQLGSDVSVAPTFGFTADRGRTRVGVVYRHGASFDFTTQDGDDPVRVGTFRVPHTLAFGASVRATPRLLFSGEVTWIDYSRLIDDFVTDQALATGQQDSFSVDDGTEIHFSGQYALLRDSGAPVRLRGGVWYDPDHSVQFDASRTPTTAFDRLFDERLGIALSEGGSQIHVTGGVGFSITPRLEFNAGFDAASRQRLLSTSLIVHLQEGP